MKEQDQLGSVTNIIPQANFGSQTNIDPKMTEAPAPEEKPARVRKKRHAIVDRKSDVQVLAFVLAIMFLGFLILTRYVVNTNKPTVGSNEANTTKDGLYYQMKLNNMQVKGQPVQLQMSVLNNSDTPKTLDFADGPNFDFIVQDRVSLFFTDVPIEVWRSSKAKKYDVNEAKSVTIIPNEEKIFSVEWDQTDNQGQKVTGDRYIITGLVNTKGGSRSLQLSR